MTQLLTLVTSRFGSLVLVGTLFGLVAKLMSDDAL